jgi:biotin carboxyl carrier protein
MIRKLRVTVDGRAYDVTVETADEPTVAAVPVTSPGLAPPVALAAMASAPTPVAAGENDVPSPLAGHVTAVHVQTSQTVKEGDCLLTLEAMKMNTFVAAPRDGTVKAVKVALGDAVEEGQSLVTLE